jgi:BirA family biotin operon repressor/biotin-[acetyl-CoA-carboxylase] ligase
LSQAPLSEWADRLARPGRPAVRVYRQLGSTQDAARRLAAEDGAVVVADEQTAGRGRLGRRWTAPAGTAVLLSRVTHVPATQRHVLALAAAVAVADAVEPALGRSIAVKWPNDVCVDGRKLAGVLIESASVSGLASGVTAAVVGVGLNVTLRAEALPASMRGRATSLAMAGGATDRLAVAEALVRALDDRLGSGSDVESAIEAWRQRCVNLGRPGRFRVGTREIAGQVIDLDPMAGLIVRTTHGTIAHLPADTTTCLA